MLERARAAAASVTDPELPPLTIDDLGILRDVRLDNGTVEVAITPTYSGCPAMREIADAIETAVRETGAEKVRVRSSDTGLDHGLADRCRAREVVGIWGSRRPNLVRERKRCLDGRRGLSSLPFDEHRTDQRVRFDRLQGTAPLPELPEPFEAFKCH